MPRNRVLSFMSQWGSSHSPDASPASTTPPPRAEAHTPVNDLKPPPRIDTASAEINSAIIDSYARQSPTPQSPSAVSRARADSRAGTRPTSMIQAYQAPQIETSDTPPELQPIFSFLNSHGNKLYQEGYFLKLHDLDSRGRPSADRTWVECFAQLVGTVLSLWDAAALDAAGVDGEIVPTFINLSDAALKMIESLPMSGASGGRLQNVLSISTAANNRYLLHFNSLNSLTQWTAGIRLAMFEHATLQEAYTGSLVAGKGRYLNNIKTIMERSRFPTEDWARVRFGAGTPWRRLWFVVTPPDEKEFQKSQKMQKKGTSYLRSQLPRGDIKFYESRKVNKKSKPVATINDVYACYAIYPQSKPLIEQSTLVKMEGLVTIHSSPETTAEGFVFIMPEVHPAVTGFEMMLRWLFPVWDTFNLYGRPTRLIADTLDQRGLMFAMPRDRRYGYLDTLDVSALIHETGSTSWSERQWRKQMKKITAERMNAQLDGSDTPGFINHRRVNSGPRHSPTASLRRPGVRFGDADTTHSTPPSRSGSPGQRGMNDDEFALPKRTDSAPPSQNVSPHKRSASEAQGYRKYQADTPSRLSHEMSRQEDYPPEPPRHDSPPQYYGRPSGPGVMQRIESGVETPTLASMQSGMHPTTDAINLPPAPVASPPALTHNPSSRPVNQPAVAPELRRAHSGVDAATLFQMQEAHSQQKREADEEYQQVTSQMVATTHDANRNVGRSNADRSQGTSQSVPAVRMHAASSSTALGSMVSAALRPESGENTEQIVAPQPAGRLAHPLPPVPADDEHRPSMPPSIKSGSSISRKPVARKALPGRSPVTSPSNASTPSEHSFRGAYIDNDALERVLSDDARLNSMGSIASSSATPDYASTASRSSASKKSVERPRMGKLKTVGDPSVPSINAYDRDFDPRTVERATNTADVPTIDFGPTYSYKPTSRPGTGATARPFDRSRSRSRDRMSAYLSGSPKVSVNNQADKRHSYFGGEESASAGYVNQAGNRQSMVWTPSAGTAPISNAALPPERWVQQRAAIANQPQVAPRSSAPATSHTRQNSSTSTVKQSRKLMKTPPPFAYNSSAERPRQQSSTPPPRPHSRGASSYFGRASPNGTSNLSAREQMQVAQATGTPMLGMSNPSRQGSTSPGLLGAVAHRELEKRAAREGLRNDQVDVAIRARQQQRAQQEAEAYRQQQNLSAQQQFQYDLQAAKVAYARSTENLRATQPAYGNDTHRRSWVQQPVTNAQDYGYANPNAQYSQGQYFNQQGQQEQHANQHGQQGQYYSQQGQQWDQRQYYQNGQNYNRR